MPISYINIITFDYLLLVYVSVMVDSKIKLGFHVKFGVVMPLNLSVFSLLYHHSEA
jgi:hypothetical protein